MERYKAAGTGKVDSFVKKNAGTIALVPAFLLCFVTLMMLILDCVMPSMSDRQYAVYPVAIRIVSLISILCMSVCFSSEISRGRLRIDLKDVFFLLFAVCIIISTALNGVTHDALFSVPYRYVGVYDLMIFILMYMYCSSRASAARLKQTFYIFFMITADLIAMAFFYNQATGSIAAFNDKLEPSATFFHGNHYGYFLVMTIAVAACCYIRYEGAITVFGAVSLLAGLGALALNRSMGCLLAAGTMLMILFIGSVIRGGTARRRAMLMAVLMVLISAVALTLLRQLREDIVQTAGEITQIFTGDNNIYAGNGRWGIWQYTLGYISDYPLWGYGCEGIAGIMKDYTLTTNPHNEPITYAAFFGVPAALFYCAGVLTSVVKGMIDGRRSAESFTAAYAALAYFLSSLFGVAMFYTAPFMFVFMGLAACGTKDDAEGV